MQPQISQMAQMNTVDAGRLATISLQGTCSACLPDRQLNPIGSTCQRYQRTLTDI
jgi:hypothetical protein